MSTQPNTSLKADQAKLCIWRKGLPNPLVFMVERDVAEGVLNAYSNTGEGRVFFQTYPDGSGARSISHFDVTDLSGVTIEVAAIQISPILPY